MAILSAEQFKYTGRGPLDAKSLVESYSDLLSVTTWTIDSKLIAYNGMIVAVWRDTEDNNGIYFLHDKNVTKPIHKPNVADQANWHKLGGINDLPGLNEQITMLQSELEQLKGDMGALQDAATEVVDGYTDLPRPGVAGKLYVATKEAITYVWHNNDYLPVGGGGAGSGSDIEVIMGGGPTV